MCHFLARRKHHKLLDHVLPSRFFRAVLGRTNLRNGLSISPGWACAVPSNTVKLGRLRFCGCRDIALKGSRRCAQLVHLSGMTAHISKISIVSTLFMGGSLVTCGDSHVVVKSCDLNHLKDGFGIFTASKVTITSSSF